MLVACSWPVAIQLLSELQQVTAVTYNSAISACQAHWPMALALLGELRAAKLATTVSFGAAARACERAGRWQEAG